MLRSRYAFNKFYPGCLIRHQLEFSDPSITSQAAFYKVNTGFPIYLFRLCAFKVILQYFFTLFLRHLLRLNAHFLSIAFALRDHKF